MNSPVSQIKERLTIEEVVSTYIKLERTGANLKARCPFHSEKTPSFFISPDRGTYYCFGCSASGDIFSFIEEFEGLDFRGALKLLAERAGVKLGDFNQKEESEKEKLFRIMEEATLYFTRNMADFPDVGKYLETRGLNETSIKNFRIGFAKNDWREIYNFLKGKGWSDQDIEQAGLAKRSEKGMYDRFRGRVMFPIADSSGRIIAFSGRLFIPVGGGQDDGKSAKYLNSPDTPIFSKSSVLYGLDKAKEAIRKNNFSILVEGQMDLVLSHQAGYKNTVASSGTALSDATVSKERVVSNLGLVKRLSNNIVLAFDGDKAGFSASLRAGRIALSLGMDVKVAKMPEGVDPADLISKEGTDAWREAVRESKHIIEFILSRAVEESKDDTRKLGRVIKETVLPYVDALESAIEKTHFIKKISDASGIPLDALVSDLKKVEQELKYEKREIEEAVESSGKLYRKDYILRKLMGAYFWQKSLKEPAISPEELLKNMASITGTSEEALIGNREPDAPDLIFEAEVFYSGGGNIKKDIDEMLSSLEEEYAKEELLKKMRELHKAEEEKDQGASAGVLKEINDLNKKIQDIKNNRK